MRRALARDLALVACVFAASYAAAAHFNLFELFVSFVRSREGGQIDELIVAMALLPIALLYVVGRRWRYTHETLISSTVAARALSDAAACYRELFDSCTAGISRWGADGTLQLANPAFAAMVGVDTVSSRLALSDLMDPPHLAALLQRARDGGPAEPTEMQWHSGARMINVRVRSGTSRSTELGTFDLHTHDLTSERGLETQLRHAQKMDGLGRLAGGIAHDFNNLLTVILNETELAKDQLPLETPAQDSLTGVLRAGERAAILTRQLLTFSRRDTVKPTTFALADVVNDMARMLERLISEDIELKVRCEPDPALVCADRSQVEQVIVNLVVNARDAMSAGGRLVVETGTRVLDATYVASHPGVTAGEYAMVAVSDSGAGMTADVQDRLFEPFFTTKEIGRGTGLGLATCFGIVTRAGGHIGVYSELGIGTTMRVYLPRCPDTAPVPAPVALAGTPDRQHATILVVEDEPGVRAIMVRLLEREGHMVLQASNGSEAALQVETQRRPIDLIISDMVMPGISVRDMAERIAQTQAEVKLMFISGYTDDIVLKHQMLEHRMPFLQKPFTSVGFATAVHAVLRDADSPCVGDLETQATFPRRLQDRRP